MVIWSMIGLFNLVYAVLSIRPDMMTHPEVKSLLMQFVQRDVRDRYEDESSLFNLIKYILK